MTAPLADTLKRAADAVAGATALLVGAGAGMGVDSGLPDFRGRQGFWNAYPPYARLGLDFASLANPRWFRDDPALAWGFYGHRMHLYRDTQPHPGFQTLRKWAAGMEHGTFVYTSNVDGQFQRAGFDPDQVYEVHGSIGHLQCTRDCGAPIRSSAAAAETVDPETLLATGGLPACPACGALARPNILMFGDSGWDSSRSDLQHERYLDWLSGLAGARLVVVELGAGTAIPSVRMTCENLARLSGGTLIRINPRESDVPPGELSLPLGAVEALSAIDALLNDPGGTPP